MNAEQIEAIYQHACEGAAESIGHTRHDWQQVADAIRTLRARVAELTDQRDNALAEAKESDGIAHAWGVQNKALTARVAELEAAGAIAAEYLESKRVVDAGPPRQEGSFGPPRSWKHNDPEVIRFHSACAALNQLAARPEVRRG